MNDFLFFILEDGSIRRINISPATLRVILDMWEAQLPKFISDDVTPILFDGQFKPGNDEVLYVDISLPENFSKIPDNTVEYDEVLLPDDNVKILALYHAGKYYFQCFSKHFVLKQHNRLLLYNKNVVLWWGNDCYEQFTDTSAFNIEDKVHAVYCDGRYYFLSYAQGKQIFDLSSFYHDATNGDIEETFRHNLFLGSDVEWLKANSDSVMRKQITLLSKSGLLDTIDVSSRSFKTWAKKAAINKDMYSSGHIVFPKDKKQCKMVLSFLNEDIFEGIFSKKIFISNSKYKQ